MPRRAKMEPREPTLKEKVDDMTRWARSRIRHVNTMIAKFPDAPEHLRAEEIAERRTLRAVLAQLGIDPMEEV